MVVHFVNNKPFMKMQSVLRELEVSHWGNVAVEEVCELKHAGAVLSGGFSRFDYQRSNLDASPSFRSLRARLAKGASNIYYRDQIGNISSSEVFSRSDGAVDLQIETRFPMFGGWQTQFYIGYSIPTESVLTVEPETHRHHFKFDIYTSFQNVWVEKMESKVVLPEGCTNIVVEAPAHVKYSFSRR